MRSFLKSTKVIIFGVAGMIGILISVGFNIKDAIEVGQMGLPTPAWTAIGLTVFFVCFFALLYLWRKHMSSAQLTELTNNTETGVSEQIDSIGQEDYSEVRVHTPFEPGSFESYKSLLAYDRYHLRTALIVQNARLSNYEFNLIGGGQLQFEFDIFNGSLLSVDVGQKVEGDLITNSRGFHDKIEPLESATIEHINWGTISIKQRVLPQVCDEIINKAKESDGIILKFNFEKVKIYIVERTPNSPSVPQYLNIPEKLTYNIKLREIKMSDSTFGDYEITLVPETRDS